MWGQELGGGGVDDLFRVFLFKKMNISKILLKKQVETNRPPPPPLPPQILSPPTDLYGPILEIFK